MKRRNADCGKLRRPIKRNKITEGMYGSTTVLYMKFLVLWAIVITADFMFMFRFEFLWPFWLLLRSVHDSFKYKGLAFSVLFVCIAITSDLVCLFFIPVHWLLFAASTYVWVQYVWHTDKGICLPTIILWMLFVYLEAGIRWKDSRHMPHLDLCRPFAAHCIGYPVVTLGFGFKSYVGYRIRQRKQREVSKENEFYMQLLQQALPPEEQPQVVPLTTAAAATHIESTISNNAVSSTQTTLTATTSTTAIKSENHFCAQNSTQSSNLTILTNTNNLSSNIIPNGTAVTNTTTTQNLIQHNGYNHHNQQQQQQQQQQNHIHLQNCNNFNHISNSSSNHCNSNSSSNSISTISMNGTATISTTQANSFATTLPTGKNLLNLPMSSSSIFNDDKQNYEALNMNGLNIGGGSNSCKGGGATANGHIGNATNSKSQRRSGDKEHKIRNGSTSSSSANETEIKRKNNINLQTDNNSNNNNNYNHNINYNGKDKNTDTENVKDKQDHQREATTNSNTSRKSNTHFNLKANNENQLPQYDLDEIVAIEPVEKTKGRRNRSKKENNASKDNHHQSNNNATQQSNHLIDVERKGQTQKSLHHQQQQQSNHQTAAATTNTTATTKEKENCNVNSTSNNQHQRSHNSDASSAPSLSSPSTTSSASLTTASTNALTNIAAKVVSKICESCLKFEADIKKYRSEISHMKQIENELRQKLESNLTTKSCLQAKQKECDELEKRLLEMTNARHADFKSSERRLTEERRQKQSLEAQLNNEKKARKLAEEKAARPECSAQCKQRKQQMDEELKQLRRDLKATEEAKLLAEQHGRKWEQELRMFEAEIRNRDSNQQPTEMLMNALAAMQDKNCTLEKNLSAETRVKLDLFSALGDAKRQLEISESRRRSKEDEVLDLKAKIAQLLAVMPTDALCLPACNSSGATSMLRMNDTPPLKQGIVQGPTSPMLANVVPTSSARIVTTNSPGDYVQQSPNDYYGNNVGPSGLDPNASVYTPKTLQTGPGGVVVVGGTNGEA